MTDKNVAVVVLSYNGKNFLEKLLPDIIRRSAPHRVIVADNGSTDDSVAFMKIHHPSVQVIRNTENFGYAEGYNRALAEVQADYFVLLNSDVEVTDNWITPVITLM